MGGPPICIGSFHPLFFVHVVVIAHTHMHMHTCTHVHTHWVIHTPTPHLLLHVCTDLFQLSLPATCTGNQNAYNRVCLDDVISLIYAALHDSSSQWWSLVWTANSKRSTWACIHLSEHAYIYLHITGARRAHWGTMYATHDSQINIHIPNLLPKLSFHLKTAVFLHCDCFIIA